MILATTRADKRWWDQATLVMLAAVLVMLGVFLAA
jgi:hypothetical protein